MVGIKEIRLSILLNCMVACIAFSVFAEETEDYIHFRLGVKFKNENNFDQALDEFRKVLTAYPDNYNAYMQIAEIKKQQNQTRLEIFNLKKALAYNPGWGKAHKMLAEAYESDKQTQNAIMEWQMYQQSCDPAEQEGVQKKIDKMLRHVQGQPAESTNDTVAAVQGKDTMQPNAHADSSARNGKTLADPAMIARKNIPPPPNTKPVAASQQSQSAGVEELMKKALSLYEQGKYDAALPNFKKAIRLKPRDGQAFFYAGLIRYKMGNYDLAKINFSKSFSYPSAAVNAHYYLGKIFATEKYFRGAVDELTAYVGKAADSDQRKDAVTVLEDCKKRINDTTAIPPAASAGATAEHAPEDVGSPRPTEPRLDIATPESAYAITEMRLDTLLTMHVVDTLTDPGQAMLHSVKQFKEGKFDEAIKEFKKILVSYPSSSVAAPCMYDIGVCYVKLRLFPNADNQFDNMRNRYPAHPLAAHALFLKALSLYERGDMSTCERTLREFIQKYRGHEWSGKAWEKLGDVYCDLKQLTKAMDSYKQASQTKDVPDQLRAYFKLAGVCFDAGNPERALLSLKKAIETGESRKTFTRVPDAYYKIADYAYQRKDLKNALEYYQRAVRKYPGFQETPWGLFQIGNVYKNLKNYKKAIDFYKELIAQHGDDYWAKQARWKLDDAVWENEYKTVLQ